MLPILRPIGQALGIFLVSLLVLFVLSISTKKGHGLGWYQMEGYILMLVGILYFVFGLSMLLFYRYTPQ
jgi:hypothetical protein